MTCKHCGSDRHLSENCRILNLVKFLNDQPYDEENLPDMVVTMSEEELLGKTEKELHDEHWALTHLRGSASTAKKVNEDG